MAATNATMPTAQMFRWPAPAYNDAAMSIVSPGSGTPKSSKNRKPPTATDPQSFSQPSRWWHGPGSGLLAAASSQSRSINRLGVQVRGSQAGCAPHREPPCQVRLDLQVGADGGAQLKLTTVVALLLAGRDERIPGATLVEVDEPYRRAAVAEEDQRAQQRR